MATRADIEINVKGLKKVQELSKQLDKVSGKVDSLNKRGGSKTEKQAANFEEKRAASMVRVRNIGDQIQRAKEAGLKTDKASRALNRAALANDKGKLKLAKAHTDSALRELKAEQATTKEMANQVKFSKLLRATRSRGSRDPMNRRMGTTSRGGGDGAVQSALVSGAFPLLFGQGPLGAVAGGAGGFIGTKLGGQMGGFAGGLVATAALQQITTTITAVGELGQALNPLTADANRLVTALGLAGTAEAERIKLIEQVEGRQAALAAATENMALVIGDDGVDALKEFGSKFNDIQGNMSQFSLKLQSKFAKMFNAIIDRFPRIFGKSRTPKEEAAFTEKLEKDTTVIALGTEIERISKELLRLKSQRGDDGGFASGPSFIKGGSTLFPSQMPDLNEEVDTAVKNKELDKSIRIAEQQLNSAKKSLDIRKRDIDTIIKGNTAQKEAKDITDLILSSTRKNVTLLEAKRDGNLQEVETQQKVADIVQRIVDLGISKDLIDEEEIKKLVEKEQKLEALLSKTKDLGSNFERIGKSIASGVSDNLTAAIMQTKTLGDAAKSILNDLSSTLIRLGVNTILGGLTGGSSGIFGSLPMLKFANGGRPPTGRPSIVGEKGPELFVPKRSGTIVPNDKLGGGSTNISVNVDASGSSVQGDEQQSKELGRAISAAIQSELLKQRRPGGLLR